MRLPNILLAVAAAAFVSNGHALPMVTGSKVSRASNVGQVAEIQAAATHNRLLRTVADGEEEERGLNWASVKSMFPGTAENMAAKAAKENKKIKGFADTFAGWNGKGREPLDVYQRWIRKGYSEKVAMKMGLRYENYLKNPSAYH